MAPMRAKLYAITPINARSRRPIRVEASMLSNRARVSADDSTTVFPTVTIRFGACTDRIVQQALAVAGFVCRICPVTSQSNGILTAARCCFTVSFDFMVPANSQ